MRHLQALGNAAVFQSLRNTALKVTGALCTGGGLVADPSSPEAFYRYARL